ncbi:hypothetical protein ACQ3I4_12030 [Zafaria sp. Z1313]|uniref:hypothetical protein n=1 Tax=unclassified Zafaria TaxID=2828765 RepID=UPI002E76FC75|nr:hypothetical protein [Zafaria sp. J156]MEE1621997.1 hypothetical protein [Zafaria sp. J156]
MVDVKRVRTIANWANLSTPLGLGLAAAAGCPVRPYRDGILVASGYRPRLPVAGAFTIGSVVFLRAHLAPAERHPGLMAHEERHASQYAACLGLPFLPLYFAAAAWSLLRTGDPASRNVFERRAGLSAGGYRERPVRPIAAVLRRTPG